MTGSYGNWPLDRRTERRRDAAALDPVRAAIIGSSGQDARDWIRSSHRAERMLKTDATVEQALNAGKSFSEAVAAANYI